MKHLFLSAGLAAFCVVSVTACGGGSGPSGTTVAQVPPPPPPPLTSCISSAPTFNANLVNRVSLTAPSTAPTIINLPLTPDPPPPTAERVTVSGNITFDLVPVDVTTNGLDYDSISQEPVMGATVQAVNNIGEVMASSLTDISGAYNLTVDPNTDLRVRVLAEIIRNDAIDYNVAVVDNTNDNAVYAIQGDLVNSGTLNSVRDLNAQSGWDGTSYSGQRAAAPFAILDAIFATVVDFIAVDNDIQFPELLIGWSPNNRAVSGDRDDGEIGTSSYVGNGVSGMIFILGDENADTDEYDRHVIVHEWGHYFEDRLSRSDSIGGEHSLSDRLDARVAMGEGWGNALSAIILEDSVYRDSSGFQQSTGFNFDVENNNNVVEGWFSEGSVQSIIYDLYDSDLDGADNIELGLGPIYDALIDENYLDQATFTTIYSFVDQIRAEVPNAIAGIDALVLEQSIEATGFEGIGETNDGNIAFALPVYHSLLPNGSTINVVSVDDAGNFNNLGNRAFVRFDIDVAGSYSFTATQVAGSTNRDPDLVLFRQGTFVGTLDSGVSDSETGSFTLATGPHVLEIFDFNNIVETGNGDVCFGLSIQAN